MAAAAAAGQRRPLHVPRQAVDDAAGLLRGHHVVVDFARRVEGLVDGLLGDLVEGDPRGRLAGRALLQQGLEVPRDGLALAVLVGGQHDGVGRGRAAGEAVDDVLLARQRHVQRLEGVVDGHPEQRAVLLLVLGRKVARRRRQVAHVPGAEVHHEVVGAQELGDRLRLGRRLDDHERAPDAVGRPRLLLLVRHGHRVQRPQRRTGRSAQRPPQEARVRRAAEPGRRADEEDEEAGYHCGSRGGHRCGHESRDPRDDGGAVGRGAVLAADAVSGRLVGVGVAVRLSQSLRLVRARQSARHAKRFVTNSNKSVCWVAGRFPAPPGRRRPRLDSWLTPAAGSGIHPPAAYRRCVRGPGCAGLALPRTAPPRTSSAQRTGPKRARRRTGKVVSRCRTIHMPSVRADRLTHRLQKHSRPTSH